MRAEYLLDYLIWRYILVEENIKKRCKELDDDCPDDDEEYNKLIFWRRWYFECMKSHRIRISRNDDACFTPTHNLVDRDELYKIDPELNLTFRKEAGLFVDKKDKDKE